MLPPIHAIFHRQIEGDESLLRLAQARFRAAGLGPEFYPGSPAELVREQQFHPRQAGGTSTVHLPRRLQVLDYASHDLVIAFSAVCEPSVRGMVLHDQGECATHFDDYVKAVFALDQRLREQGPGPMIFIEYAWGLTVPEFIRIFDATAECSRIGACIDISHIGIRECRRAFERTCPGIDLNKLKWDVEGLRAKVDEVQTACTAASPAVLSAVQAIGALGKPLHFHLHDSHPCSTFSAYGVSDHLSFGREIPIPFSYRGEHVLPPIYGPLGLRETLQAALRTRAAPHVTMTLEIHAPVPAERRALGEYRGVFQHWRDTANAERMNHWIDVLRRNHRLVREAAKMDNTVFPLR